MHNSILKSTDPRINVDANLKVITGSQYVYQVIAKDLNESEVICFINHYIRSQLYIEDRKRAINYLTGRATDARYMVLVNETVYAVFDCSLDALPNTLAVVTIGKIPNGFSEIDTGVHIGSMLMASRMRKMHDSNPAQELLVFSLDGIQCFATKVDYGFLTSKTDVCEITIISTVRKGTIGIDSPIDISAEGHVIYPSLGNTLRVKKVLAGIGIPQLLAAPAAEGNPIANWLEMVKDDEFCRLGYYSVPDLFNRLAQINENALTAIRSGYCFIFNPVDHQSNRNLITRMAQQYQTLSLELNNIEELVRIHYIDVVKIKQVETDLEYADFIARILSIKDLLAELLEKFNAFSSVYLEAHLSKKE